MDCSNLVYGILDLAHRLNLAVVAEGVETKEQLKALKDAGYSQMQGYLFQMQGYLFGRPMPSYDLPAFLMSRDLRMGKVIRLVHSDAAVAP